MQLWSVIIWCIYIDCIFTLRVSFFFANGIHRSLFLPTGLLSTFIWWEALINFQFQFADILGTDFSILNWANIHSPSVLHTFTCYEPWYRAQIWGLKDGQNHSPETLLNLTDHCWAPLEQRFVIEDLWKVKNIPWMNLWPEKMCCSFTIGWFDIFLLFIAFLLDHGEIIVCMPGNLKIHGLIYAFSIKMLLKVWMKNLHRTCWASNSLPS